MPEVTLNAPLKQFEVSLDGRKAVLTFEQRHGALSLMHTEVPTEFRGQRIADALAAAALDYARTHGLTVKPYCPFVAQFIKRHPQYAELIDQQFPWPVDAPRVK